MTRADDLRRKASDCSQPSMQYWRDIALEAIDVVVELEDELNESQDEFLGSKTEVMAFIRSHARRECEQVMKQGQTVEAQQYQEREKLADVVVEKLLGKRAEIAEAVVERLHRRLEPRKLDPLGMPWGDDVDDDEDDILLGQRY